MKLYSKSPLSLLCLVFTVITLFSCSKDSDLLADYVALEPELLIAKFVRNDSYQISISNNPEDETFEIEVNSGVGGADSSGSSGTTVNDSYQISSSASIVLDVLANDTFKDLDNVSIIETSQPEGGSVVINSENTLTYMPSSLEAGESTFTYTVEFIKQDGKVGNETGIVNITLNNQDSQILNEDVAYWRDLFDSKWADNQSDAWSKSKSANKFQEYYYLGYYIDGLTAIWQATGDNSYLEEVLKLIENTIEDAIAMDGINTGYLGWPSDLSEHGTTRYQEGTSLWEAFMFRHVATLLRIMYQSPNLRASGYQSRYENILTFTEKDIFEKWANNDGGIYRSRTHMASHWARIGMELYVITGNQKYKEVFDNISFGTMPIRNSNLRNQLSFNPNNPKAYVWSAQWGVNYDSAIQDSSHAGAIVSFWVKAYENEMYWNSDDINALVSTLDEVIWQDSDGSEFKENVDGSGGYDHSGRIHEWLPLGRFSPKLQNKIKNSYTGSNLNYYGSQPLGIAALNAKIISDGIPVYPEN